MPNWTKEQQDAIDMEGSNIIVSAGAGSGKTAVLTARVLRKLKEGIRIDELLILTFTKAAAAEMKERIRTSIKKEKDLKEQLDYIDAAYITTFDSFALSIVKKYHDLLNVSKDILVLDEPLIQTFKKHALEEIFEDSYQEGNREFCKLIEDFCKRDDANIKEMILKVSKKLDLLPNKKEYLETYERIHFKSEKIEEDVSSYISYLKEKILDFHHELEHFSTYVDGEYIEKCEAIFNPLWQANTYEEMVNAKSLSLPRLKKGSEEEVKQKKEQLNDLWKSFKETLIYENSEEMKETIFMTKDYVHAVIELLLKLENKVSTYKREKDAYEFTDIALLATELVQNHKEVKEELKNHFKEILIDEYQDTNDLQETFVREISNQNIYMVGDIKQSIYRFRNANPHLFKTKYDTYSKLQDGRKIDLNKNFRSRKEVLENINYLFENIMDEEFGGADYRTSHEMAFGNLTYLEEGLTNQNYNFEVYKYPYEKKNLYKQEEIEAFIVAKDIKEKIENHYQIFDKESKMLRDITYSDCVILMDRGTNFDLYKRIFEYYQIPLTLYRDESLTKEADVFVLKNILKLLNKIKKKEFDEELDYCYVSIARSFLFSCKDSDILEVLMEKRMKEEKIYQKALEIVKDYDHLTINEILERVLHSFEFYPKLITIGGVKEAKIRLEYIFNMGESLSHLGYTIYDFTDYLEEMIQESEDIKYSTGTNNGDTCKIMTIHKSKGLEYPICYFTGLYKKFNMKEMKERFFYDTKYGIVTPYYKEGIGTTFYKELVEEEMIKEEISEKIRLFYVALTRAKEKMIFVTSMKEEREMEKENGVISSMIRRKYRSFDDIFSSIAPLLVPYTKDISFEELNLNKDYLRNKKQKEWKKVQKNGPSFIKREHAISNPDMEETHFSKETYSLLTKKEKKNMEFGTKMHEVLEYFDMKHPNFDGMDPFIKEKLRMFIENPILQDLEHANIYQEYEFYEEGSTHGVIDLLLEWEDHIFIIDYKLKNLKEEAYKKQLKGYGNHIEKITGKKVRLFLYSLLTGEIEEI